jgi:hypothetical protein
MSRLATGKKKPSLQLNPDIRALSLFTSFTSKGLIPKYVLTHFYYVLVWLITICLENQNPFVSALLLDFGILELHRIRKDLTHSKRGFGCENLKNGTKVK